MDSQSERLKRDREAAGFRTAKDAAQHFRWVVSTYAAHENGQNGLKSSSAARYAKAFNVTPEWLLLGTDPGELMGLESEFRLLNEAQRQFVLTGLNNLIETAKKFPKK